MPISVAGGPQRARPARQSKVTKDKNVKKSSMFRQFQFLSAFFAYSRN